VLDVVELLPSETTTGWLPAPTVDGTVNVMIELPVVLAVAPEVTVAALPPTVTVSGAALLKPLATRVTEVPVGPLTWLRESAEGVTLSGAAAGVEAPATVRRTAFAPAGVGGTTKVTATLPDDDVVPPPVTVAGLPPTVTVAADEAGNPVPNSVSVLPTLAVNGLGEPRTL
jgi:hypothetical protein